jgi:N-carbamoylputrescine amidase
MVANGVYVAAANRIGLEQYLPDTAGIQFWDLLALPGHNFSASLTRQKRNPNCRSRFRLTRKMRQNWPFFRDRRIDALEILQKRLTKLSFDIKKPAEK